MNASHWKLPNGTKRSREFPEQLKLVANYTRTTRERGNERGEGGVRRQGGGSSLSCSALWQLQRRTETKANTWHTWPLGAALPLIELRCICRSAAAAAVAAASVCASACSAYRNLSGGARIAHVSVLVSK